MKQLILKSALAIWKSGLLILILCLLFNANYLFGQEAHISSISNPSVVEGNSGTTTLTFVVTCDPCDAVNVIVKWRINDLTATTADNDYVDISGELDDVGQAPGVETFNISVSVNGDTNFEPDETLQLELFMPSVGPPSFYLDVSTGTGTIINDDGANQSPDCSGAAIANQVANASCQAIISGNDVTGVSDPDGDPLAISVSPTVLSLGANSVTVSADDGAGGTCVQVINVNVNDTWDPVPDMASLTDATGECSASVLTPTATDNCAGIIMGSTGDPTTYLNQGTFFVTWNYSDGNGNSAQQIQTVIVDDVTSPDPDIADLPDLTGECEINVTTIPTATDNCEGSISGTTSDLLSYTEQGTFNITWTYDDGNGNTSLQNQTIIVDDVTSPDPDIADLPDLTGECEVNVTTIPTATDNCEGSISGTTSDLLSYTEQGTFNITWTYDDGNGNTSLQNQTIIVDDVTSPDPDIADLPVLTGECEVNVTTIPTATDNCEGSISGTTSDLLSYTEQGTFNITWTYDDGNGNITQQTQAVIVDDITPPFINTISDPIELWPPNHKYSTIDLADCVLAVSDNCNMNLTLSDVFITEVSSDEPENVKGKGGGGDGNTINDIVIASDCGSVDLRRERQGKGNGRVYNIFLALDDGNGNTGTAICQVSIPHDQSGTPAVDDGPGSGYTEASECALTSFMTADSRKGVLEDDNNGTLTLDQNYPNPFNSMTTITFHTPQSGNVNLDIYDMRGQLIKKLHSGYIRKGNHSLVWDSNDVRGLPAASGLYIYKLESQDHVIIKKLFIMKLEN